MKGKDREVAGEKTKSQKKKIKLTAIFLRTSSKKDVIKVDDKKLTTGKSHFQTNFSLDFIEKG
jgi:hypothetical protein